MHNIVFILAGGTGSRVGGETPKQFLPLSDGRSVLEHSVDAFEQSHYIHEIVIVMHPDWMDEAQELIRKNNWQKVKHLTGFSVLKSVRTIIWSNRLIPRNLLQE